jgi:hypothetical protein
VPIFIGGVLAWLIERHANVGDDPEAKERLHRRGVLFSAGLITGEALMGIVIAGFIYATKDKDVLAVAGPLQPAGALAEWIGLAVLGIVSWLLYNTARRRDFT